MPMDALAVTVTASGVMQVAVPVLPIVAMELFAVLQVRPSPCVSVREDSSLNVPTAENVTVPCEDAAAVAVRGLTEMLVRFGDSTPQPSKSEPRTSVKAVAVAFIVTPV
jgi:hypothetical protein